MRPTACLTTISGGQPDPERDIAGHHGGLRRLAVLSGEFEV
jgi:hypothetical protein